MMFQTIDQIKRANHDAGYYFFSPNSMRFFARRVLGDVYGGRYFVTSERRHTPHAPRRYTVRVVHDDGDVGTVGEYQAYKTAAAARAAAKRLAAEG